jgi:hypothetical protein
LRLRAEITGVEILGTANNEFMTIVQI